MENDKKKASFYILEILKEYSDETHPLKQNDIILKLKMKHGISIERKTIGSTIKFLQELGYDILQSGKNGFYLSERDMNKNYIKYLIDSVYSNKYISQKDTQDIIKNLTKDLSIYEQESFEYVKDLNKMVNKDARELFTNIETISDAIKNKKKIEFKYMSYDKDGKLYPRHDSQIYQVSPYFMINNQGKYYLICDSADKKLYNYRMEYIREATIIDEEITSIKEMQGYTTKQNYINEHIYMFAGNTINAKILVKNNAYTYIYEWFGEKAHVETIDGVDYAFIRTNENALIYWLLQYMQYYEIVEPIDVRNKVINLLKSTLQSYQK